MEGVSPPAFPLYIRKREEKTRLRRPLKPTNEQAQAWHPEDLATRPRGRGYSQSVTSADFVFPRAGDSMPWPGDVASLVQPILSYPFSPTVLFQSPARKPKVEFLPTPRLPCEMQSFESRPAVKQADLDSMGHEAAFDAASLNSSDDTPLLFLQNTAAYPRFVIWGELNPRARDGRGIYPRKRSVWSAEIRPICQEEEIEQLQCSSRSLISCAIHRSIASQRQFGVMSIDQLDLADSSSDEHADGTVVPTGPRHPVRRQPATFAA
ncbi:hypothetical protein B0H13DRAFT_2300792 [Mycena leptocephala]|nr:hypothetical protein B0H13DRAFT_2300792 [Mycena leptocephala]